MTSPSERLSAVFREIDLANGEDPRRVIIEERDWPYEGLYARRMTERLERLYPGASELLRIAAHAQHIRRWEIPRSRYPEGRAGYESWRRACRAHHVSVITPILKRHGYTQDEIGHVAKLIRKEELKRDPESQALENVVAIVFVEHYMGEFIEKYAALPEDKRIDILLKTLRKMSTEGHAAVLALPLRPEIRTLIDKALSRLSDRAQL